MAVYEDIAGAVNIASNFKTEADSQFNHIMIGERMARLGFYVALITSEKNVNLCLLSEPGGAKSTMLDNVYRLIEGMDPDDIAYVPHRPDLPASELVGQTNSATRTLTPENGNAVTESITASTEAIIDVGTRGIAFDEINRANPFTLTAALGVLAKRELKKDGRNIKLPNIEYVISALNPEDHGEASFRLPPALAARQTIGALMGFGTEEERHEIVDGIWDTNFNPSPEKMESAITIRGLKQVREALPYVAITDDARKLGKYLTMKTVDMLRSMKSGETDGRISRNLMDVTQALAMLNGREVANENDVKLAAQLGITGRLGARNKSVAYIREASENLVAAA